MNYGAGAIYTTKNNPSGAPFVAGSAENGVSVDPVTGKIVLGNDVGSLLAQLLSDREITMNDFLIRLLNASEGLGSLVLSSGNITGGNFDDGVKLMVEGSTVTKRAVGYSEVGVTIDPHNDSFGVFAAGLPPP